MIGNDCEFDTKQRTISSPEVIEWMTNFEHKSNSKDFEYLNHTIKLSEILIR